MNLERLADLEQQYGKGVSISDEIDIICDEFEQAWRSGQTPHIDDFVRRVDPSSRSQLYSELLAVDFEIRQKKSQQADFEALFANPGSAAEQPAGGAPGSSTGGPVPAPITATIAHYELIEKLGAGGFGTVWRSRDTRLTRIVAVKLSRNYLESAQDPERFLREARIAAQLQHPGIVSVYEVGFAQERAFIVSEFIDGKNLDRWFAATTHSSADAAQICCKIAQALEYAHQNGVIHRDLKPANILVDSTGEPHIADFGVAKCLTHETTNTVEGQLLGTPAYMSPEQADGRAHQVDARSDVYSLGVILYELISGQVPFEGPLTFVLQQIVNDEPPAPRVMNVHAPRDLESICLKAMAKDPADRYASAGDMADDLERFLNGEHTVARPVTLLERAWRRLRRHSLATGGAAFLALMVPLASVLSWNSARNLEKASVSAPAIVPATVAAATRPVRITTNPPGARAAVVPIDEETGRPIASQAIRPKGKTPFALDLPAATYLIVVDIPGYGFHEVYRLVPGKDEIAPSNLRAAQSQLQPDGTLDLSIIDILPESELISGMTLFAGGRFEMGDDVPGGIPIHECDLAPFYLATREVTVAEYLQQFSALPDSVASRNLNLADSDALRGVAFPQALNYAECVGLRLPTEEEYEFAATAGGTRRFPWGDDESVIGQWEFGPAGKPEYDQTETSPPVFGLYSNVAEWTDSRRLPGPGLGGGMAFPVPEMFKTMALQSRVVRGSPFTVVLGGADKGALRLDPRWGHPVGQFEFHAGVGFRCARSIKPRFLD